jgi:predicted esterase YcpF (UPF0227 family)
MIINIHGFNSNGNNSKLQWLRDNNHGHDVYSPTFDYKNENPISILDHLKNKISLEYKEETPKSTIEYIIGSSLGGFYAYALQSVYPCIKAILLNPSLLPFMTLRKNHDLPLWICKNYLDIISRYIYDKDEDYLTYGGRNNLYVIIGDQDEIIDHKNMTIPLLPDNNQIYIIKGGTHRLEITSEVENILKSIIKPPMNINEKGNIIVHNNDSLRLP